MSVVGPLHAVGLEDKVISDPYRVETVSLSFFRPLDTLFDRPLVTKMGQKQAKF